MEAHQCNRAGRRAAVRPVEAGACGRTPEHYGVSHVLTITPALARQHEPGWFEQYRQAREAIHASLFRQN